MDWGAYQYQQNRLARKQKVKQKASEIKGIRISFKIGTHDRDMRVEQAKKFLERGDRVKLEILLRGRENQFSQRAAQMLKDFVTAIGEKAFIEGTISRTGNRYSILIGYKK